jgi:hypothetical protein
VTHPLSGQTSVEESARLIRHYRYAVERMMRVLGGWIALTPEISAKLLMGHHVWDNAQHADALGRRLPELRAQAHVSEPASPAFAQFLDAIEEAQEPEQTVERLVGVYQVLKPHLLASYAAHLERVNQVYEPPTHRILSRCAEDERRHIGAGLAVLRHLTGTPGLEARARHWQGRLETLLASSGGVAGLGLPTVPPAGGSAPPATLSDDAEELIQLERAGGAWAMPGDLESAVRQLAEAVIERDGASLSRCCVRDVACPEGFETGLAQRTLGTYRVVALATVGRQRLVKLRFEGPDGSVALLTRWTPGEDGWRAAALHWAAVHTASPA